MHDQLIARLLRYSEKCIADRLDADFAAAVGEAVKALGEVHTVVLCKDCRHRDPEDHKCDSGETERQGCPFKVADDYYCAYGER